LTCCSLRFRPYSPIGLGKVVDYLIRKSATPVLLIPPDVAASHPLFTLRHILVPLDGSALAE
jgi:hypothetical protein